MNERVCSRGPTERGGGDRGARKEGGVHAGVPGQGTMTPAQEEKAAVYKELGYRPAGMVGKHLTARPMKTQGGSRSRPWRRTGRRGHVVSISLGDT